MNEVWKPIDGFDGYKVSNLGRVWSDKTGRFLSANIRSRTAPYLEVQLCIKQKHKHKSIHRLVAEAFIDNPEGKEQVNHIDGDKQNNRVDNLEWVTCSENAIHAHRIGLRHTPPNRTEKAIRSRQRKVRNKETGEVFDSIVESAKAIGGQHSGVSKCLNGERTHYMGYHFEYAD